MQLRAEIETHLSADSPDDLGRRRELLGEILEAFEQGDAPTVEALLTRRAERYQRECNAFIKTLGRYLEGDAG